MSDTASPESVSPPPTSSEPTASKKTYYDDMGFYQELTSIDGPNYDWRPIWVSKLNENGVQVSDPTAQQWEGLTKSMREHIVLDHYLQQLGEYAQQKSPTHWEYVLKQSTGFTVANSSNFGEVHEGASIIGVNPRYLMALIKSGEEERMAEAFTLLVHDAKHVELNHYLNGGLPLPENANPALGQKSFTGYMLREEICWKTQETLFHEFTGKSLERTWLDPEIQDFYRDAYSAYR